MGDLSNTATDIVGGLRVLRGIGGEQVFLDRYRRESQTTRRAGVAVARLQSVLDALQVFLPGVFVVVVVWLGARSAVDRAASRPGELVAFYGYSAFLMIPLRTATEYANKLIRARVAAAPGLPRARARGRPHRPAAPAAVPGPRLGPVDARTGLRVRAGLLTAVVSERPEETAALADRLGLYAAEVDDDVRLGGVPLTALRRADVRRRIVVSDTGATLFSGRLGDGLDVTGRRRRRPRARDRVRRRHPRRAARGPGHGRWPSAAAAFSGGQRQRLVLARVLTGDPEVLVLVEPTSAVDAHTEARIAARLRAHRAGRTTVVISTSPLMLDAVDEVAFLATAGSWRPGRTATCSGRSPPTAPS